MATGRNADPDDIVSAGKSKTPTDYPDGGTTIAKQLIQINDPATVQNDIAGGGKGPAVLNDRHPHIALLQRSRG